MSHWYDRDGTPRYEIEGKKGMRQTTLRDARKHGWVPSVSTIWKDMVAAPGLTRYYQDQLFEAQINNPRKVLEEDKDYKKRVFSISRDAALNAAERGTMVHGVLENSFRHGWTHEDHVDLIKGTKEKVLEVCGEQEWKVETSFAHGLGYGGKIDMHCDEWMVDFKTKELDSGKKPDLYDSYGVQLAAYDHGLGGGRKLLNLFISVSSPGYVVEHQWEERERLTDMFTTALKLWQLTKRYDPSWQA